MYLKSRPDKAKNQQEKEDIATSYRPGMNVIPSLSLETDSDDSDDQRLLDQARDLSLREMRVLHRSDRSGRGGSQMDRRSRRGLDGLGHFVSHVSRPLHESVNSVGRALHSNSRSFDSSDWSSEDIDQNQQGVQLQHSEFPRSTPSRNIIEQSQSALRRILESDSHSGRRTSRNTIDGSVRPERPLTAALNRSHLGHSSSLRSIITASDLDNSDMEDDIMDFVAREGLFDHVDLDNLTPEQEEELTEYIALVIGMQNQTTSRPRYNERRPRNARENRIVRDADDHARSRSASNPVQSSVSLSNDAAEPYRARNRRTTRGTRQVSTSSHTTTNAQTLLSPPIDIAHRIPRRPVPNSQLISTYSRSADSNLDTDLSGSSPHASADYSISLPHRSATNVRIGTSPSSTSHSPTSSYRRHSPLNNMPLVLSSSHHIPRRPVTTSNISAALAARVEQNIPSFSCAHCKLSNIQTSMHYNCSICDEGTFNICKDCYRAGKGCHQQWFGFGYLGMINHEKACSTQPLHILSARRWMTLSACTPETSLATLTPTLHQGLFCDGCFSSANDCYWHCEICNDGAWGYCQSCVRTGKMCTHPLEAVAQVRSETEVLNVKNLPHVPDSTSYGRVILPCDCDICHQAISLCDPRYHCYTCSSGDYDMCMSCYNSLVSVGKIKAENGPTGWRKCPLAHRMVIVGLQEQTSPSELHIPAISKRVVLQDLVGGCALKEDSTDQHDQSSSSFDLYQPDISPDTRLRWRWRENEKSDEVRSTPFVHHSPLLSPTMSSVKYSPLSYSVLSSNTTFPPSGGTGLILQAQWSWFPVNNVKDELSFPKGAEIREAEDINGDWFWGVYAGQKGLFPGKYARVIGST